MAHTPHHTPLRWPLNWVVDILLESILVSLHRGPEYPPGMKIVRDVGTSCLSCPEYPTPQNEKLAEVSTSSFSGPEYPPIHTHQMKSWQIWAHGHIEFQWSRVPL